jgi:hypothetical protein
MAAADGGEKVRRRAAGMSISYTWASYSLLELVFLPQD